MRVCLTHKYAEMLDGVDLSKKDVGDVLDLAPRDARLLLAEQWAIPDRRQTERIWMSQPERASATDHTPRRTPHRGPRRRRIP